MGPWTRRAFQARGTRGRHRLPLLRRWWCLLAAIFFSVVGILNYDKPWSLRLSVWIALPTALLELGVGLACVARRGAVLKFAASASETLARAGRKELVGGIAIAAAACALLELFRWRVSIGLKHSINADLDDLALPLSAGGASPPDAADADSAERRREDRRLRYSRLRQHFHQKYFNDQEAEQKDPPAERGTLFQI